MLLFVDQFEELFLFANLGSEHSVDPVSAAERRDEATKFVRLLLTAMKSPRLPIHNCVYQSDRIGDCTPFMACLKRSAEPVSGARHDARSEGGCDP